jgi:hypothetical protein
MKNRYSDMINEVRGDSYRRLNVRQPRRSLWLLWLGVACLVFPIAYHLARGGR